MGYDLKHDPIANLPAPVRQFHPGINVVFQFPFGCKFLKMQSNAHFMVHAIFTNHSYTQQGGHRGSLTVGMTRPWPWLPGRKPRVRADHSRFPGVLNTPVIGSRSEEHTSELQSREN